MEVTGHFLQFLWEDRRVAASEMWDVILAGSAPGSPPQALLPRRLSGHIKLFQQLPLSAAK